jgi:UDP-glucose 4-epimerase
MATAGPPMKALVTGGAGFIGSNVCRLLLAKGWEVVVLDNLMSGYRQNLVEAPRFAFVEGDVRDAAAVRRAIAGCGVVFHLAASVGNKRSIDQPLVDAEINLLGTIQVLEAAREAGVARIVVSSSAGIFGELKTLPIAEDHPLDPDTPYGVSKLAEEKVSLAYSKLHGIEVACLRYFNVFGPNQRFDAYGNVIPIFVFRALRGEPIHIFGDGEQTRDFVNVADVAEANLNAALAKGVIGSFNIGSGTRISINALVATLQSIIGGRMEVLHGPPRPGDVRDSLADIAKARAQLGYAPSVDLIAGLRTYVDWARSEVAAPASR